MLGSLFGKNITARVAGISGQAVPNRIPPRYTTRVAGISGQMVTNRIPPRYTSITKLLGEYENTYLNEHAVRTSATCILGNANCF